MLLTLAWSALGIAAFSVFVLDRRNRNAQLRRLRGKWGSAPDRDRDMVAIAAYHRSRAGEASRALDDRTWDDLNMNDVFSVLDRTESVVGQQILYARLRTTPQDGLSLGAFEALVTRMSEDAPARERAQLALGRLRTPAGYDLWWLAQPGSLEITSWHLLFPIAGVSMAGVAVLVPIWPPAVLLLVAGAVSSLIARASVARSLRVVAGAFRQLRPLVAAAEALSSLDSAATAPLTGTLRADASRLTRLRSIASWAGRDSTPAIGGDLAALFFEYLNEST
jgi:hypothetical protein